MRAFKDLFALCGAALLIAGCALPLGDDVVLRRDGSSDESGSVMSYITDYNLQSYIPIPSTGRRPVTEITGRGDMDITVAWKDEAGVALPLPFGMFMPNTVYTAEIRLTPRAGYSFYPSAPFNYPPGKVEIQNDDLGASTRIVRVTYNNSDEADLTYITDYDLQRYVPAPMTGDKPVRSVTARQDLTITAAWEVENPPNSAAFVPVSSADSFTFAYGAVYRATISLTVKPGYRFYPARNFVYIDNTVTVPQGDVTDPRNRSFQARYPAAKAPTVINDPNLTLYIPKPVSGTTPAISFSGTQYTGTILWKNTVTQAVLTGPFQTGVGYTAELTLAPAFGYTVTGIKKNWFTHTGAETITNGENSGMVRIGFSPIPAGGGTTVVYDTNLTNRIFRPVKGGVPVQSFSGSQYSGTILWKDTDTQTRLNGAFRAGVAYTAVAALKAAPGYTFTGIGRNVFSHKDASGAVINPAGGDTVTINFPPTSASLAVTSFGPAETGGSALKLMRERRNDSYPLVIDLPGGTEPIVRSVTLTVGDTSPGNVTIDGHHRVLRPVSAGVTLMVGNGVTLTLRNLTLQGISRNSDPLIRIEAGGKLILGTGAILTENQSNGYAGGVWVNGGELVLNDGAVIKKMEAEYGGGVYIDGNGTFTMSGGTIGGGVSDGNTSFGEHSGGGVFVHDGLFAMYGGTIRFNQADAGWSAGGVGVWLRRGTFNLYNGTIEGNRTMQPNSGGGVGLVGDSSVADSDAHGVINQYGGTIQGNTAGGDNSGGGALIMKGIFTMNGGTIAKNSALGADSGGGVNSRTFFTMHRGTIQGNTAAASRSGGGVYMGAGTFTMHSGTIQGNTAAALRSGGGIGINGSSSCTVYGGTIAGNAAHGNASAGGLYVNSKTVGLYGGEIKGNTARSTTSSGGVYITQNYGEFVMGGGEIKNNANYGVYVESLYRGLGGFTMTGDAKVDQSNRVFLAPNAYIIIDSLAFGSGVLANIAYNNPTRTTKLLGSSRATVINTHKDRFLVNDVFGKIAAEVQESPYGVSYYYGYYRP
jgi:hypothetical protein